MIIVLIFWGVVVNNRIFALKQVRNSKKKYFLEHNYII